MLGRWVAVRGVLAAVCKALTLTLTLPLTLTLTLSLSLSLTLTLTLTLSLSLALALTLTLPAALCKALIEWYFVNFLPLPYWYDANP